MKRAFDFVVSLSLILLLSPVIILTALAVRLLLGAPVLYSQVRPGYRGRPFRIYKFRTMTDQTDEQGKLLPDAQRLSRFGRFLRASSLDELPAMWNVLKGEMSLVGPRPLLVEYLSLYTDEQNRRHDVKPGITGWAQVNGRNDISWQEKFRLDVWYVDNQSQWLDIRIMLMTVVKILKREGIAKSGHATTDYFQGND